MLIFQRTCMWHLLDSSTQEASTMTTFSSLAAIAAATSAKASCHKGLDHTKRSGHGGSRSYIRQHQQQAATNEK